MNLSPAVRSSLYLLSLVLALPGVGLGAACLVFGNGIVTNSPSSFFGVLLDTGAFLLPWGLLVCFVALVALVIGGLIPRLRWLASFCVVGLAILSSIVVLLLATVNFSPEHLSVLVLAMSSALLSGGLQRVFCKNGIREEIMKLRAFAFPLLILYPLYAGIMFSKQEQILFPAFSEKHYALKVPQPANGKLVEIPASFGNVRAFYQPATTASAGPAIIYTHGNFECIQDSFSLVRPLVDGGVGVLQVEFPGFCGADADPSFKNIVEAENLAYDWLASQSEVDKSRIVAMGYSIGGGAASELTRHRPVRALILLSTYSSLEDIAHHYMLPGFLVRYPFDNVARVREYNGPVYFEHGKHDQVIPFALGQKLAQSKPGSEFVALDCGHDTCHFDQTLFVERVPAWLARNGVLASRKNQPEMASIPASESQTHD